MDNKLMAGSCCCGAVTFIIKSLPNLMGTCHCNRCRKVGASTFVFVSKLHFQLLSGQDNISVYNPGSPYKYKRSFCTLCGTALGDIGLQTEQVIIPINCFDEDLGLENKFHCYVSEKPSWYKITDDAEQFEQDIDD